MVQPRWYRYVGPADLRDEAVAVNAVVLDAPATLDGWLGSQGREERNEPFTFVIALDGMLRLGPRRSEHVALASGQDVLAAGELRFAPDGAGRCVVEVTNQSTGYCPDPDCWPAVGVALDLLGVRHPGEFTAKLVFRRCPACGERNIVRDGDFTCALCDSALPKLWNFIPN
ncbi:hypothetical protein AB0M36_29240 [Actinoplanes sp. NPDC051346]|uniref:hypothetical protein n=1 Tax=Actinoplanes sp. NPDC051346 TaxID=3155048 RepID=UPI00342FE618